MTMKRESTDESVEGTNDRVVLRRSEVYEGAWWKCLDCTQSGSVKPEAEAVALGQVHYDLHQQPPTRISVTFTVPAIERKRFLALLSRVQIAYPGSEIREEEAP